MTKICHSGVEQLLQPHERELQEFCSLPGLKVMDSSFFNGFMKRRIVSSGLAYTTSEAWYAERRFHEILTESFERRNGDSLPWDLSFPRTAVSEFERGVSHLLRFDDPVEAIRSRWKGYHGQPSRAETKLDLLLEQDQENGKQAFEECARQLRSAVSSYARFATEDFVSYDSSYAQPFETRISDKLHHEIGKKVDQRKPAREEHFEPLYARSLASAGLTKRGHREIQVAPFILAPPPQRSGADLEIFMLALAASQKGPVYLVTADSDFEWMQRYYYGNRPKGDPITHLYVALDYGGKPHITPPPIQKH